MSKSMQVASRSGLVLGVCASFWYGRALEGQSLRGRVLDSASAAPVAGALLSLVDNSGVERARGLSRDNGRYQLDVTAGGAYRIRILRIGYRPVTSGVIHLPETGEIAFDVRISGLPVRLDTIRTVSRNECHNIAQQTSFPAYLAWEQTRAALQATQLTAASRIQATVITFRRTLDPRDSSLRQQHSSVSRVSGLRPWATVPAESLRAAGYVLRDVRGTVTYRAPDVSALLSPQFLEDHCFRELIAGGADEISLPFEPVRSRGRIPEIEGRVVLDRSTSELRRVDFQFVNLPDGVGEGIASGSVQFGKSITGDWFVTHWRIRMPVVRSREPGIPTARGGTRRQTRTYLDHLLEEGGELALVVRGRDSIWAKARITVAGIVNDSTGRPVADAIVRISGTALQSPTDSLGAFAIHSIVPGDYSIEAATPASRTLGLSDRQKLTAIVRDTAVRLVLPAASQLRQAACGSSGDGAVIGRVLEIDGETPRAQAQVIVRDASGTLMGHTESDVVGRFRLCAIPFERVELAARHGGSASREDVRVTPTQPIVYTELRLADRATHSLLYGRVIDAVSGYPVPNAEVGVQGTEVRGSTDAEGQYRVPEVPLGVQTLQVRKIGYAPTSIELNIGAIAVVERDIVLSRAPVAQILDTVQTEASAVIPSFEEHRAIGLGQFIGSRELEAQKHRRLRDVIAQLRGVRVQTGVSGRAWLYSGRRPTTSIMSKGTSRGELDPADMKSGAVAGMCYAQVYVDDALVYAGREQEPLFDLNTLPTSQIEAIEYYAGPASTPLRYSKLNSQCGVLVIHLRKAR